MVKHVDVIIIGAGAAGLMCAGLAAKRKRKVLVIDHANKAGKKILMSGGGRCNFTNLNVTPDNFISHNRHFCRSALSRYTENDFINLVEKYKIPYHEKTKGQLFCDNKSKDILNMLLAEAEKHTADILLNTKVVSVEKETSNNAEKEYNFKIETSQGVFKCQSVVIASGGLSIPTMGASAFGYELAKQLGIKVWPTRAGLVPFTLHVPDLDRLHVLSGVSVDCEVLCGATKFTDPMLFTHRGLSGPAMLQISSYWHPGEEIEINFLPDLDLECELQQAAQSSLLKTLLTPLLPKRMLGLWLPDDLLNSVIGNLNKKQRQHVVQILQHYKIKPNATEGYRTAEVTLGGVDCDAISSKTMQANDHPGLFFIGEVLDVTGWLGGYNFQWAWASAAAAAEVV